MQKRSIFITHALWALVFVIAVFMLSMPLMAKSPAGSSTEKSSIVHLIGIIDPDGQKRIYAFPAETAVGITRRLAAKYPRKTIDGVSFFRVTSWRDTSRLAVEASAQQGLLIVGLYKELKSLKMNAPGTQLARRVNKLEKRLNAMTDAGNP
jgi:hypothetical protein